MCSEDKIIAQRVLGSVYIQDTVSSKIGRVSEKLTFEQKLKGDEGGTMLLSGTGISERRNCRPKGSEFKEHLDSPSKWKEGRK